MTTIHKALVAITVISLAVAGGTGIYETHRISQMQAEVSALRQEQAPLRQRVEQLSQERDAARKQLAEIRQEDEQGKADQVAPATAPTNSLSQEAAAESTSSTSTNPFSGFAAMFKDPQMKEMMHAQQKMVVEQMYGGLYKKLSMTAAEEDSLRKLLADRQVALMDAGLAAMGAGDAKTPAPDTKAIKADYDKQLQDFLGPQAYAVFQQYDETVAERVQLNLFKQSLSADNALTGQQEDDLIAAMYQARKALPENSLANNQMSDPSKLTEDSITQAMKIQDQLQKQYTQSASTILTPAQLDQFTKFQQQMSSMQAAGMKMAQQMFGQKKPDAPAAANSGSTP